MESIILSMTIKERRNPDIINPSRKRRIAAGCGMEVQDINRLLKQHSQMAKMMRKFSNPAGIAKMLRGMKDLQGAGGGGGLGPLFGGGDSAQGGQGNMPGSMPLPPGFGKKR